MKLTKVELGTVRKDEVELLMDADPDWVPALGEVKLPVDVVKVFDSPVLLDVGIEPLVSPVTSTDEVLLIVSIPDVDTETGEALVADEDPVADVRDMPPELDSDETKIR